MAIVYTTRKEPGLLRVPASPLVEGRRLSAQSARSTSSSQSDCQEHLLLLAYGREAMQH